MIITTSFSISASSLRYLKFCSQGRSHKNGGIRLWDFHCSWASLYAYLGFYTGSVFIWGVELGKNP